jgi:hypothetical protein
VLPVEKRPDTLAITAAEMANETALSQNTVEAPANPAIAPPIAGPTVPPIVELTDRRLFA